MHEWIPPGHPCKGFPQNFLQKLKKHEGKMNIHTIVKRERGGDGRRKNCQEYDSCNLAPPDTHNPDTLESTFYVAHGHPQLALHSLSSPGLLFPPLSHSQSVGFKCKWIHTGLCISTLKCQMMASCGSVQETCKLTDTRNMQSHTHVCACTCMYFCTWNGHFISTHSHIQ